VDAVVEGSVLRAGTRVRLNLQLTDARTNHSSWSRSYEQEVSDILQLQRQAAAGVLEATGVRLTPAERARLGRVRPVNAAAHDVYLRAQYVLSGMPETPQNTARALEEFEHAIRLDPAFAPAHVGLALAHQLRGTYLGGNPPLEQRRLAYAAARKALELDPELGEAHAILARVQLSEFDWVSARGSFEKMMEFSPGHAPGLIWHAYSLLEEDRVAEALAVVARAEAMDPLDLNTRVRVGFVHLLVGQNDEAARRFREVLALDADNLMATTFLISACVRTGRADEALMRAEDALRRHGRLSLILAELASATIGAGRRTEAQALLNELLERSRRQYVAPANLATIYELLGDRDRAFEWFERAYEERSNYMMFYPVDRARRFRDDPRFQRLVQKIRAPHTVR
jgi:tetratricopeptide (TPR) repeat protein